MSNDAVKLTKPIHKLEAVHSFRFRFKYGRSCVIRHMFHTKHVHCRTVSVRLVADRKRRRRRLAAHPVADHILSPSTDRIALLRALAFEIQSSSHGFVSRFGRFKGIAFWCFLAEWQCSFFQTLSQTLGRHFSSEEFTVQRMVQAQQDPFEFFSVITETL
nr:hypothetical protein Iba_chr12cCG1020 [Ipomoea batatas]